MKWVVLSVLAVGLSGCAEMNMRACKNMCGLQGVKEFKNGDCTCGDAWVPRTVEKKSDS